MGKVLSIRNLLSQEVPDAKDQNFIAPVNKAEMPAEQLTFVYLTNKQINNLFLF